MKLVTLAGKSWLGVKLVAATNKRRRRRRHHFRRLHMTARIDASRVTFIMRRPSVFLAGAELCSLVAYLKKLILAELHRDITCVSLSLGAKLATAG